jgi:large subunit ribosomal protein L6
VSVTLAGDEVQVKGSKGELKRVFPHGVSFEVKDKYVEVHVADPENRQQRAFWGLSRALLANMIEGVSKGFVKKLEIKGIGNRAELKGTTLVLYVGFSHQVEFNAQPGITLTVEKNIITVSGIDKQVVGETAANIRKIKKPEPYKGKGIRYVGEQVRQKAGKVVKSAAA